MTTIGIIGAGSIGSNIAQAAVRNGYDVVLSNSRGPETLADLVAQLGPRARAATPAEAAAAADLAVVSIPLSAYRELPVDPLAGKVVLDTTNYFWERDGRIAELDAKTTTDAELIQQHLPTSRVVKAFNHLRAAEIAADGTPAGTPSRRALGIAGDDVEAKAAATSLYDEFGFDAVDVGSLADSWRLGRGSPAQVVRQTAAELQANAAAARQEDRS